MVITFPRPERALPALLAVPRMFVLRRAIATRLVFGCLRRRAVPVLRDAVVRTVDRRGVARALLRDVARRTSDMTVVLRVLRLRMRVDAARFPRALVPRVEIERLVVARCDVGRADVRPRVDALREDVLRDVLRRRPVPLLCERDDAVVRELLRGFAPRCPVLRVPALLRCELRALVLARPLGRRPRGSSLFFSACAVLRLTSLLKLLLSPCSVVSWRRSASPRSSNFANHSFQSISSSLFSPV